jgi:hypothetical protein
VYFNNYGLLMAVSPTATTVDKTTLLGPMLGKQFAIDLAASFLLCLLVGRIGGGSPRQVGTTAALFALALVGVKELADWTWYGFSLPYAAVNIVDQTIAWFIAGATAAALLARFTDRIHTTAERIAVPAGQGYRSPGHSANR